MNARNISKPKSRYQSLMIFIALFVFSIVTVLALNFYVSRQFASDALEINLAGRQRMLSQRIAKSIANVRKAAQSGTSISKPLGELKSAHSLFDATLTAFDKGGQTKGASGDGVTLEAVTVGDGRTAVDAATTIWTGYNETLKGFINSDDAALTALSTATNDALTKNNELLKLMNQLTLELERSGADGEAINLAGRQRMLSQRITKSLYEYALAGSENGNQAQVHQALTRDAKLFDDTLRAFSRGGATQNTMGAATQLTAVSDPGLSSILNRASTLWAPIKSNVDALNRLDRGSLIKLAEASEIADAQNLNMLKLMNDLTVSLEKDSRSRSALMRWIQIAGITFALLMFGIILFHFLGQLRRSDAEVLAAKKETDQILGTIKGGLFLLDKEFTVGDQHSQALTGILKKDEVAGQDFLSVIKSMIPETTFGTVKDYLGLLFGDKVNEKLVTDLNPLDLVEVNSDSGSQHLEFRFTRAKEGKDTSHLLVEVDDVSDRVRLEQELAESQEKAEAQFDLLLNVLHVEPDVLVEFLDDTERQLYSINDTLKEDSLVKSDYSKKIAEMFRKMHAIKGDAAGLELTLFENKAHEFEDLLEPMRNSTSLKGSDFLPLTIKLDEFISHIETLKALVGRLGGIKTALAGNKQPAAPQTESPVTAVTPSPVATPVVEDANSVTPDPLLDAIAAADAVPAPAAVEVASVETADLVEFRAPVIETPVVDETTGDFARLGELVNRVADDMNKQVTLNFTGSELIYDEHRSDVKQILIQFARNSVVHGIEDVTDRIMSDKQSTGQIDVAVTRNDQSGVDIVFRDDGRGLSAMKIRDKALERGLIPAERASEMTPEQCMGLIFKSGFSTAASVDRHAGRGVGMDVVIETIRELGGKLNIKSTEGEFCEFRISLPCPVPKTETSAEQGVA